jgi:PAS domain S-box-containing protein
VLWEEIENLKWFVSGGEVNMPVETGEFRSLREEAYKDLLNLLYEITSTIPSKLDVDELVKSIIRGLKRLGFDRAGLWLLNENGDRLRGTWGTDESGNLKDERGEELPLYALPALHGYLVRITDARLAEELGVKPGADIHIPKGEENRFEEIWGSEPPYPGYYDRTERGDNISLPIVVLGKAIGAIGVDNFITGRRIEKEDAEIFAMFTANTGIVLHNARLMAELHQRTTFLESILDNANLWIDLLDDEGNVVLWNKAAERISGYTREEVIGHGKIWEWLYPDPDYRAEVVAKAQEIIRGTPVEAFETKIATKSGEEKIISWYSTNLYDVDGDSAGSVAIGEDITGRREMEQALKRSVEEYRRAIDTANSFVVRLDEDGRITLFNRFAEELTGYTKDEVIGGSWFDIFISDDKREATRGVFENLKSTGQPLTYENPIRTKDDRNILVLWSNNLIRDSAGNAIGTLSYGIDVTQQRRLERQLAQSEKMSALGQLISGVAHELNNPLTGVVGYSQLLLGADCSDETRHMLTIVSREADRCHKIVDSLLQFAREYEPRREYTQINDVIESTLSLKRYQLHVDNIQLELHLSEDIPETMVDPHQMQQVFMNIVNNAHQAMVEHAGGGKLTVETDVRAGLGSVSTDDTIVIRFTDTGPGIYEENIGRIFDPFFTTKESGKGTGLGLSICHSIVEEHDGKIYADSEVGKGTTFTVELAVIAEEAISATEPNGEKAIEATRPVGTTPETESRILIVDDEQGILDLFTDILEMMGHMAVTARNGSQAVDRLDEGEYDLIICDMKMPGFSGKRLYNFIKATDPGLAKRIVFVTGDTVSPETQSFLQSTGNMYIGKPFRVEEAKQIILRSLSRNSSQRSAFSPQEEPLGWQ